MSRATEVPQDRAPRAPRCLRGASGEVGLHDPVRVSSSSPLRCQDALTLGGSLTGELSELLTCDQLIPVVHGATYEAVRKVRPFARLPTRVGHGGGLDGSDCYQD